MNRYVRAKIKSDETDKRKELINYVVDNNIGLYVNHVYNVEGGYGHLDDQVSFFILGPFTDDAFDTVKDHLENEMKLETKEVAKTK